MASSGYVLPTDSSRALLVRFLLHGLERDRTSAWKPGLGASDEQQELAKFFVDLPFALRATEPSEDDEKQKARFLRAMLCNENSLYPSIPEFEEKSRCASQRWILFGGPGQGKTSLTQFLAQAHRALLLREESDLSFSSVTARDNTLQCVQRCLEETSTPSTRFPLRVVLPDLAKKCLALGPPNESALLEFLLTDTLKTNVSAEELELFKNVLREGRWILLLDGLDEVFAPEPRRWILDAWQSFCRAFEQHDGWTIITTRPQGYDDSIDAATAIHLVPFARAHAKGYANTLLQGWFPTNPERQQRALETLFSDEKAISAELLRSPLQVTILAALAEQLDALPEYRWSLFESYYLAMEARERKKPTCPEVLSKDSAFVRDLHRVVGLHLHVREELGYGKSFTKSEFTALAQSLLIARGFRESRAREIAANATQAALDRLVLLSCQRSESFGFELRSFQEFFAAEQLLQGEATQLTSRLVTIGARPSWKNVVTFFASGVFEKRSDDASLLLDACDRLDQEGDEDLAPTLHLGAQLAANLLLDRAARKNPAVASKLLAHALQVLNGPFVGRAIRRLAEVFAFWRNDPDVESLPLLMNWFVEHSSVSERKTIALLALLGLEGAVVPEQLSAWVEKIPEQEALRLCRYWGRGGVGDKRAREFAELLSRVLRDRWSRIEPCFIPIGMYAMLQSGLPAEAIKLLRDSAVDKWVELDCGRRGVWWRPIQSQDGGSALSLPSEAAAGWSVLLAIQQFLRDPSPSLLVRLVKLVGESSEFNLPRGLLYPWPVEAVLEAIEDIGSAEIVYEQVEEGLFGDASLWKRIEERWNAKKEFTTEELRSWLADERREVKLETCLPFWSLSLFSEESVSLFGDLPETKRVARLKQRALEFMDTALSANELRSVCSKRSIVGVNELIGVLPSQWEAELLEVLEEIAPKVFLLDSADGSLGAKAYAAWKREPFRIGLLVLASRALERNFFLHPLPSLSVDAKPEARAAAAEIRYSSQRFSTEELRSLLLDEGTRTAVLSRIDTQVSRETPTRRPSIDGRTHRVLRSFAIDPNSSLAETALELLAQSGAALTPAITENGRWKALGLRDPQPPAPSFGIVRLQHLRIQNYRCFQEATLVPAFPPEHEGQWIVFLGDNGSGKTTLLRAIALALTDLGNASAVLADVASSELRTSQGEASCAVAASGHSFVTRLRYENGRHIVEEVERTSSLRPFVLGYGCRRGGAAGGGKKLEELFAPKGEIDSLFDAIGGLIPATLWLQRIALDAANDRGGPAEELFETVKSVLLKLLPGVDELRVTGQDDVRLSGENVGENIPITALSDGYITTMGWVVDMLARWTKRCIDARIPIDKDFHRTMEGIVLLDEIDLHLHPVWARGVLRKVRETFPRMSFIVTTHNPITLLGTRPGEVWVLERTDGETQLLQHDLEPGMRLDNVLASRLFQLDALLDDETLHLMQQHQQLLAKNIPANDPQRLGIEQRLRARTRGALEHIVPAPLNDQQKEKAKQTIAALLGDDDPTGALQ